MIPSRLANFSHTFDWAEAPDVARTMLQVSLLDFCAVALAGAQEPASRIAREMVLADVGRPEASVIGASQKCPARGAALSNGVTGHALDYDDTHFLHIGHLAVVIFPATLAMAEREGVDGRAFLTAAMIGYEGAARIGDWLGRSHYEAGFHQTATSGTFGAVLAAGRLARLSVAQLMQALGLAASHATGLKNQFGSMGKPYNAAAAAAAGIECARLMQGGFQGNPKALAGFGAAHAGAGNVTAFDSLGRDFVTENISHKFHACCHGTHAVLEALMTICAKNLPAPPLSPAEVDAVEIAVHPRWLTVCNVATPQTGLQAKFSLKQVAALQISGFDTGALGSFTTALCADAGIAALRKKITVTGDEALADGAARVRVWRKLGECLYATHDLDAPLPCQLRARRVHQKAAILVGTATANALWHAIKALPEAKSVEPLAGLLRRGA